MEAQNIQISSTPPFLLTEIVGGQPLYLANISYSTGLAERSTSVDLGISVSPVFLHESFPGYSDLG